MSIFDDMSFTGKIYRRQDEIRPVARLAIGFQALKGHSTALEDKNPMEQTIIQLDGLGNIA